MLRFMKKLISITLSFLISGIIFAENQNLSAQMKSSYESGFYPGVVRYAEQILRSEKDSILAFRAAVYEGESLFKMGRTKDARSVLEKYKMEADNLNPETIQLNSARFYWLGRCFFEQKDFSKAQSSFFSSASVFQEFKKISPKMAQNSSDYYSFALLYGGKSYFEQADYKNAIPLFEYVISNGTKFASDDYKDCALSLALSYNFIGDAKNAKKCVNLVSSLEKASFDSETKKSLLIQKGEAYKKLGQNKEADEAFKLAGDGSRAAETSTLLAINAFNEKNYKSSSAYFDEAASSANLEQRKIAAVYRAEIAYITASDKNSGANGALDILLDCLKSEKITKPEDSLDETVILSIARYNAYLKNWKECENYVTKCQKSENPEIQRNSVYWIALSKYECGEISKAVSVIETYKKKHKLEDKSILNLYAKALAKQGKYHEADTIFYSLGEKNQLDNDGRLDYSRTLLIAGHYISTKEQASKATGDEALYLSALASFNQRRWKEAENSFAKVLNSKTLGKDYVAYAQFYSGYAQYQSGDYEKSVAGLNRFISENPLHAFVWSAYMTVARASAFLKNDSQAVPAAKKAISTAKNDSEKQEAILLTAGILSDSRRFDEALSLLSPYILQRTEFGYECKYKSAEIFVLQGKMAEADKYFAELASSNDKKAALIAEESSYRRAEIAYSEKNYVKSAGLFEEYIKKFAGGRFNFAAIYFAADSLAKTGDEIRAIMRYEEITDSTAETSYRYGAEKNLVELYEKTGDYAAALSMANKMIATYGSQAVNDGMDKKAKELQKLASGKVVSNDEKIKTAEKRLAQNKKEPSKSEGNMNDALFLAGAYRNRGENKKSAEMYLDAAKYSRQAGNDENAARAFYGAVESFDAAGLYADSKATFTELKKLYPESKYTKDGEKIAGGL